MQMTTNPQRARRVAIDHENSKGMGAQPPHGAKGQLRAIKAPGLELICKVQRFQFSRKRVGATAFMAKSSDFA